jgi:hypothetical protein
MNNHVAYVGLAVIFVLVVAYMVVYNLRMKAAAKSGKWLGTAGPESENVEELRAKGVRID